MGDKAIGYANTGSAIAESSEKGGKVGAVERKHKRNQRFALGNELGDKTAVRIAQVGAWGNEFKKMAA